MVKESGGGGETRAVREAAEPDGSGGQNAAGSAGALRCEDRRGLHGKDAPAMVEDARADSQGGDRRVASNRGSVQLFQPGSCQRAEQSGVGRRRTDGYRVLSDYHVAIYFWRGANSRGGTNRKRSRVQDGPIVVDDSGVSVGAIGVHLQHAGGAVPTNAILGDKRTSRD